MELMDKCTCGNALHINAGDSIQSGVYRWYASYHCDKCGNDTEIDGFGIDSIPDDIKALIIKNEGEWGLKSLAGKAKVKYIMDKMSLCQNRELLEETFYIGTQNQVQWVKNLLVAKGIAESDLFLYNTRYSTDSCS